MTYEEKLVKLIEVSKQEGSAIRKKIAVNDLLRLVEGDLSNIGDGILENRVVLVRGEKIGCGYFKGIAEHYSLAPRTRTVFGIEVEEFEDADFKGGCYISVYDVYFSYEGMRFVSGLASYLSKVASLPLEFKHPHEAAAVADAMNRLMNISVEDAEAVNKLLDSRMENQNEKND